MLEEHPETAQHVDEENAEQEEVIARDVLRVGCYSVDPRTSTMQLARRKSRDDHRR